MCRMRPLLRARDDQGAAAVEFGLVAILLLTLMIGIIQFAIWFWAYQVGAHAAREGARQYAVHPCDTAANEALVQSRVGSAADGAVAVVGTVSGQTAGVVEVGDEATVKVTFTTHTIGGLLSALPSIDKSATTRVEYVPAGGC